jgi:hypothetical protein
MATKKKRCRHPKAKKHLPPPWVFADIEICECGAYRYEGDRMWIYPKKKGKVG